MVLLVGNKIRIIIGLYDFHSPFQLYIIEHEKLPEIFKQKQEVHRNTGGGAERVVGVRHNIYMLCASAVCCVQPLSGFAEYISCGYWCVSFPFLL